MKRALHYLSLAVIISAGCATVQRGSSEEVTIRHGSGADFDTIQDKAEEYCGQFGKTAHLRVTHRGNISIFDCK